MPAGELHFIAGEPDPDEQPTECPSCGFDAVLTFPVYAADHAGVGLAGKVPVCLRCASEEVEHDGES